ncbi:hypothetical protein ACFW04_013174 [Cataglyphis niger]
MYSKFRKTYYGCDKDQALFNLVKFKTFGPIVVIDCSRQNELIKSATVDVRIEFDCKENVPSNTTAYCLIIHDRVVEYNPLTNVVTKRLKKRKFKGANIITSTRDDDGLADRCRPSGFRRRRKICREGGSRANKWRRINAPHFPRANGVEFTDEDGEDTHPRRYLPRDQSRSRDSIQNLVETLNADYEDIESLYKCY